MKAPPTASRRRTADAVPTTLADLVIVLGAFAIGAGIAAAGGAANFGTALGFGQLSFALALLYVLVRR